VRRPASGELIGSTPREAADPSGDSLADVINDDWVQRYSTDRANLPRSTQDPR
jgi:LPS sulfotransferase NodH